MKYCRSCGNQLEENVRFCGKCGAVYEAGDGKLQNTKRPQNRKGKIWIVAIVVLICMIAVGGIGVMLIKGQSDEEQPEKPIEKVADEGNEALAEEEKPEKGRRKIQKDVKNTLIVNGHLGYSGAITEDGSLYMWGSLIGNGTRSQLTPLKCLKMYVCRNIIKL